MAWSAGKSFNLFIFLSSDKGKKDTERKREREREVLALHPRLSVPVDGTCAPDAGS